MRYTAAFSLALAGSALAAGGGDTVNQVLTSIASDLKDFDSAIKSYSGDASSLVSASKKIEQTTTSGASAITSGSDLSLTDAVGITSNVQTLQTTLDSTLSDLKSIGDKLASAGQCSTILDNLKSQGVTAQGLQDAITGKAPPETKAVSQQLGGAIGASIADTTQYFTKLCASAPSAPSGGSSSSAPKSGGSSSSGSAPSSGGASAPASGDHGSSTGAGAHGSKTNKASKTSAVPKPATYTGAGNTLTVPFIGAIALALFAL